MFPGKKKNTTIVSAPTERKVPQALSQAAGKPWLILAVIAALPLVLLLAFTFKSGYTPSSKGGKFDKIVSVKTSAELADEATSALQKNDYQTFSDILQNKIKNDINIVNSKGDPLIVMAATFGNLQAVQDLVLAGADINAKNNYNHSPMYLALEKRQGEFIDLFLSSGVREGLNSDYLFRACATKNAMGVLAMLKGGVDPNVKNEKGNTPLIISASLGDVPSVRSLMAYRADVNAANNDGNTALIYAARYNHPDTIRELLKPQTMQTPIDVNMQNKLGQTALYWGASKGFEDVVRRLLAADADPTLADNSGLVPYIAAQKNGRGQILKWFNKDLREVKNSVIDEDNKALMAQAKAEGRELPDPNAAPAEKPLTDDDIFTAAAQGDLDLAKRVLDMNKAVVFNKNKAGFTPLHIAVENGRTELVDFLITKGGLLFEASPKGNILHLAVLSQNIDMLKHLVLLSRREGRLAMMLEYKAVPAGYKQAMTPLAFAAIACNQEIYNYLVSVGAKPGNLTTTPNMLGYVTPADLMAQCKAKITQAKQLTPAPQTKQPDKKASAQSRRRR